MAQKEATLFSVRLPAQAAVMVAQVMTRLDLTQAVRVVPAVAAAVVVQK
jgi:hypothetical protein